LKTAELERDSDALKKPRRLAIEHWPKQKHLLLKNLASGEQPAKDEKLKKKINYITHIDKYKLGRVIGMPPPLSSGPGHGAYASVRLAFDPEQQSQFAIKIYEKSKLNCSQKKKSVQREIMIL